MPLLRVLISFQYFKMLDRRFWQMSTKIISIREYGHHIKPYFKDERGLVIKI